MVMRLVDAIINADPAAAALETELLSLVNHLTDDQIHKLSRGGLLSQVKLHTVRAGDNVSIGPFGVSIRPRTTMSPFSAVHLYALVHSRSVTLCSPGASKTQSPVYQSA